MLAESSGDGESKRDALYELVLLDIICGQLRAGESVDEATLAERYHAGRAAVRDTLFRLALEGLIERRPRLGSIVTSPSIIELDQVFQLRVQLEGQCARLAASNATKVERQAIQGTFRGAAGAIDRADWRTLVVLDREFHTAIASAAHNSWLQHVLAALHNSALRFWHYALPRRPIDALTQEIAYHRAVAAAIEARDPAAAEAAMRAVLGEFPATVQGLFLQSGDYRA
jgi:DNA-binding GntR family transcriptional regulator